MTAHVALGGPPAAAPAVGGALPQRVAARLTGSVWFWAVFVFAVFAVPVFRSVTRPLPAAPPVLGELPAFALTDQQGKPVTGESLRGFVVLAEFVSAERFAEKPTAAASLVRRMRNTGGSVRIVSFVDAPPGTPPWCDADAARAALPRWIHASGGLAAFEAAARKASGLPDDLPLWGRLLLIDASGRIRRVAVPLKPELDQLMRDTGFLVNMEGR
jgi:hypothetical protein